MRNSAFSTVTTNSRGVQSSLTRMTLCRRGRSTLVLTLVFGLVTVMFMQRRLLGRGRARSAGAALRQALRHALIAASHGCFDQFTGSSLVLKLGVLREFRTDQRRHRAGFV